MRSKALLWSARSTAGHPSMSGFEQLSQNASTALAAAPSTLAQRGPICPLPRGPAPARCA
eukprot:13340566-Heterocapsa_arctica.AAC.1